MCVLGYRGCVLYVRVLGYGGCVCWGTGDVFCAGVRGMCVVCACIDWGMGDVCCMGVDWGMGGVCCSVCAGVWGVCLLVCRVGYRDVGYVALCGCVDGGVLCSW